MTRPIKYRALYKGKLYEVASINFAIGVVELAYYASPVDIEDVELQQFTGLTDKNGKEIYEGDVVREVDTDVPLRLGYLGVKNGMFWLYDKTGDDVGFGGADHDSSKVEVIGNIHENPELITKEA